MTVRLQIGSHQTTLFIDGGTQVVLALGTAQLVRDHLRHEPPTTGEVETAIEVIEDALMPSIWRLRGPEALVTTDAESVALAIAAGAVGGVAAELDMDAIERVFNRLVNISAGRPAASEGISARGTFAANLLIVRELMHHAGRSKLLVHGQLHDPES